MDRIAKLTQLADSYLDHIRIAVEAGDTGAPFRDFLDNWAAFSADADHHRTASNRVIWFNNPDAIGRRRMLLSLPFRSQGAEDILAYADQNPAEYRKRRDAKDTAVRLVVDHAVPLAVMKELLFQPDVDLSRDGIRSHLGRYYHLGLLTHSDDLRLNGLKLRFQMPRGWDGVDLTARYRAAGISAFVGPQTGLQLPPAGTPPP